MGYKNSEGYTDRTAGIAIEHVCREERKENKMAKRSCRRTMDENIVHDKAVKIRKMTDAQLIQYIDDKTEKAKKEGYKEGMKAMPSKPINIDKLLEEIGSVKGIGIGKMQDIKAILENRLGVTNG